MNPPKKIKEEKVDSTKGLTTDPTYQIKTFLYETQFKSSQLLTRAPSTECNEQITVVDGNARNPAFGATTKNEELKNIIRNSKYNFLQVLCNNTQTKQMLIVFHSFHCVINSKFNLLFQ